MLVLTLNLWNTQAPFAPRMDELRRFLGTVRPDLVLLQEVALVEGEPQTGLVTRDLGYRTHYLPAGTWAGQIEGLAILTLGPSTRVAEARLSPAPGEIERAALVVELAGPDGARVHALCSHLAYRGEHADHRLRQATECVSLLEQTTRERGAIPLVGADLNEPSGPALRAFTSSSWLGLRDLRALGAPGRTDASFDWSNAWASAHLAIGQNLDYLLAGSALTADFCSLALCEHDGWARVSDHYGVLARVRKDHRPC